VTIKLEKTASILSMPKDNDISTGSPLGSIPGRGMKGAISTRIAIIKSNSMMPGKSWNWNIIIS